MPAGMMIANPGDQDEAKDLLVDGPCAGTVGGGRVLRKNLPSLLSLGSERPAVGNKGGIELCRTRDRQLAVRRDSVMSDASPPGAGPNRRFVTPNM